MRGTVRSMALVALLATLGGRVYADSPDGEEAERPGEAGEAAGSEADPDVRRREGRDEPGGTVVPVRGVLRDNADEIVTSGSFAMTFRLYADAISGTPVWTSRRPPGGGSCRGRERDSGCVVVEDGVYTVALGSRKPLDPELLDEHDTLWLGVSVEGEPEQPRRRLGRAAVPRAGARSPGRGFSPGVYDVTPWRWTPCPNCPERAPLVFERSPWSDVDEGETRRSSVSERSVPAWEVYRERRSGSRACSSRREGRVRYDAEAGQLRICDGESWRAVDRSPSDLVFERIGSSEPGTVVVSEGVAIRGVTVPVEAAVSGEGDPELRICDDHECRKVLRRWQKRVGSVLRGQYVQLRVSTAPEAGATRRAKLRVGDEVARWSVTTAAGEGARPAGEAEAD